MRHWFKVRPIVVMVLLFAAPLGAIAHLMVTWAPQTIAVRRLAYAIPEQTNALTQNVQALEQVRSTTARLQALATEHGGPGQRRWLPEPCHNEISNTLAATLQGRGIVVEDLTFDEPALYTATADGDVLACECVSARCRGSYTNLTAALDRLSHEDLPLSITQLEWQRNDSDVTVTLHLRIPFVPDAQLDAALRDEAGLETGDEE